MTQVPNVGFNLIYIQGDDSEYTLEVVGDHPADFPFDVPTDLKLYSRQTSSNLMPDSTDLIDLSNRDKRVILDAVLVLQRLKRTGEV